MTIRKKKTTLTNQSQFKTTWFVLDAAGKTLGRFAAEVAKILRGKHKPTYTPFMDAGDGVIVINADKISVTGAKSAQKVYRYYTGSMGGMREIGYRTMLARKPEYIIEHAVRGMVAKSRQGRHQLGRLRVFAGPTHTMQAQEPIQANV